MTKNDLEKAAEKAYPLSEYEIQYQSLAYRDRDTFIAGAQFVLDQQAKDAHLNTQKE